MFRRKSATQTKKLLEVLASAQKERQLKNEHVIAQAAAADKRNAELASTIGKLGNLLKGALHQDTYIDLDGLQKTPRIPAFNRAKPERRSYLPEPPSRIALFMPWKKKAYDWQYESAETSYRNDRDDYYKALNDHQNQIDQEREAVDEYNQNIERYKQDFAAGQPKAIEEYFALVLEKSAYPAGFPNTAIISYAAEAKSLRIEFALPALDVIPAVKSWTYDKIRDDITAIAMPRKRRRLLYSSALAQISLRSIHEVFTADRSNKIDSIAFEGYADAINPSSGQPGRFRLVALSLSRGQFDALNLECVEPRACLKGLNGRLSRKPDQLLALPRAMPEDDGDTTAEDEEDRARLNGRISELESALQEQAAEMTELKTKLAASRKQTREQTSTLRDKQAVVSEMESKLETQRDRLAELAPNLRDEQERNAELKAEIQEQKDYIAELESRLAAQRDASAEPIDLATETPDDTQPIESIAEIKPDSDPAAPGIFAPITSETPEADAGGRRIPPREPEWQASKDAAQKPKLLEIMSVFAEAQGSYVDYIGEGLPKEQINRLVREGRLERHKFHTYKLRATLAGNKWYRERLSLQDPPEPEPASSSPKVKHEAEKTIRLGELLSGKVASAVAADIKPNAPAHRDNKTAELLQRPPGTPPDLLTDLEALVTIMGDYGSETSRLIVKMAENNWACNHDSLEAIFKGDEHVTFANNIIDIINDRANEKVENPLIIEENDQWIIEEEFRDEIEHILKHPEYLSNS